MSGRRSHPDMWWAIHNLIAHPISEVCHWVGRFGDWLHDATVPDREEGTGRG